MNSRLVVCSLVHKQVVTWQSRQIAMEKSLHLASQVSVLEFQSLMMIIALADNFHTIKTPSDLLQNDRGRPKGSQMGIMLTRLRGFHIANYAEKRFRMNF